MYIYIYVHHRDSNFAPILRISHPVMGLGSSTPCERSNASQMTLLEAPRCALKVDLLRRNILNSILFTNSQILLFSTS